MSLTNYCKILSFDFVDNTNIYDAVLFYRALKKRTVTYDDNDRIQNNLLNYKIQETDDEDDDTDTDDMK